VCVEEGAAWRRMNNNQNQNQNQSGMVEHISATVKLFVTMIN
jgi:hypothetical protein